jgi:hypothetical protein
MDRIDRTPYLPWCLGVLSILSMLSASRNSRRRYRGLRLDQGRRVQLVPLDRAAGLTVRTGVR